MGFVADAYKYRFAFAMVYSLESRPPFLQAFQFVCKENTIELLLHEYFDEKNPKMLLRTKDESV